MTNLKNGIDECQTVAEMVLGHKGRKNISQAGTGNSSWTEIDNEDISDGKMY